jgi:diaminopimelate epimerase
VSHTGIDVVKMSGAGNDFLVLGPGQTERIEGDLKEWVRRVCRHGVSVGADGVLVVTPRATNRLHVRFFNPDGSEAFCGNGTRCAARFARLRGLADRSMILETAAGEVPAEVCDDVVRLQLPAPRDAGRLSLEIEEERIEGRWIVAGSPHFVTFVDAPERVPLERWGPAVRRHPRFGREGVNFDVAHHAEGRKMAVRTWERGVERETLACGSGAVAAAFAAWLEGHTDPITIVPASGIPLEVGFGESGAVQLTGDARVIFEGRLGRESTHGFPRSH